MNELRNLDVHLCCFKFYSLLLKLYCNLCMCSIFFLVKGAIPFTRFSKGFVMKKIIPFLWRHWAYPDSMDEELFVSCWSHAGLVSLIAFVGW